MTRSQLDVPDGDFSQPQAIPAYKPRKTVKSPAIQTAVLTRRAIGHSKAKIARDLGIAVNTVTSISELNDFDREIEAGRIGCVKLIPQALRVAEHRLSQNSENMAIKVLENTIWPIQGKAGKAGDPGLTLAIQNLMLGPTQVNNASTLHQNAAEPSTNNEQPIVQVADCKQDKP